MRTVCGSKFQTVGAEDRKARLEKSVLMNGWSSCRMADEHNSLIKKRVVRFGSVDKLEWTCSELCMSELPTCMLSTAGLATNTAGVVTA